MDISVSPDHVHIFFQYPPKYSVSFIARRLKGRSSRLLREKIPELKKWWKNGLWAAVIMEVSDMAGKLLRNISPDKTGNHDRCKNAYLFSQEVLYIRTQIAD
ncbi:MAG: IS200/IS605 family transposase [Candidatus Methanoperedens sp.]